MRRVATGLLTALTLVAGGGCRERGTPTPAPPAASAPAGVTTPAGRDEGTRRMVDRLRELDRTADLEGNPYLNSRRAEARRRWVAQSPSPVEEAVRRCDLGVELMLAGAFEDAIREFRTVEHAVYTQRLDVDPRLGPHVRSMLALAHLRLGEVENCLTMHSVDSCLMPFAGSGIHTVPRGSRGAVHYLELVLGERPGDLTSIWLLNLAYMTLGEHPDAVSPQWLIPPEAFDSDGDIGRFHDIAPALGLDVVGLSGGSIVEDLDGDGFLDVMASSWGLTDQIRLFRNEGDGSFADRTDEAGLAGLTGGLNMVDADYDNDGDVDVLVLRGAWLGAAGRHPNSLLRNNGDGTFSDVSEAAGLLGLHPTQTASWADYDGDGWIDLFIANETTPGSVHPCELYHNDRDGTFTECAAQCGVDVTGYIKAAIWGDYDNDDRPDLYVSRLDGPNTLFRNEGPAEAGGEAWRFRDVTAAAGVAEPLESFPCWFFDYDNDGWLDLFVSGYGLQHIGEQAADYLGLPHTGALPRLYRNRGDGTFEDVTRQARVDALLLTMGSNFGDLDNDGWLDFYAGTGEPDFRAQVPNRMFRNAEGRFFQDVTTSGGFGNVQKGHGISFADIDHDGDQDIHQVMGGAYEGDVYHNLLFENPGHGHHWITLELEGRRSNRSAIGARVRVAIATPAGGRDVHVTVGTGGTFGCSSLRQEIGLGRATAIREIEVRWPASGLTQRFEQADLDRAYRIVEGERELAPMTLRRFDLTAARERMLAPHEHEHDQQR